jgi:hypothetical protein
MIRKEEKIFDEFSNTLLGKQDFEHFYEKAMSYLKNDRYIKVNVYISIKDRPQELVINDFGEFKEFVHRKDVIANISFIIGAYFDNDEAHQFTFLYNPISGLRLKISSHDNVWLQETITNMEDYLTEYLSSKAIPEKIDSKETMQHINITIENNTSGKTKNPLDIVQKIFSIITMGRNFFRSL